MREREEREGVREGGERKGEREWFEVRSKKRKRLEAKRCNGRSDIAAANGVGSSSMEQVSFFFTEIPLDFGAKEMHRVFAKHGDIVEVVIPARRDKNGRRFGFARFTNVSDAEFLATKLDNIFIGNRKLHVNLPRFRREVPQEKEVRSDDKIKPKVGGFRRPLKEAERRFGTSYAQAVRDPKQVNVNGRTIDKGPAAGSNMPRNIKSFGRGLWRSNKQVKQRYVRTNAHANLEYNVDVEVLKEMGNKYVGVVSVAGTTYALQDEFYRQGLFSINVVPLGANLVLLEAETNDDMQALIAEGRVWLESWFDEIRPWRPRDVDNERLSWVRVYGVPPHVWDEKFFKFLITPIGAFIDVDDNTKEKKHLDVARVLFRSKHHTLINMVSSVRINGMVYSIKLVEDWYGPMQWMIPSIYSPAVMDSDDGSCGGGSEYSDDTVMGVEGESLQVPINCNNDEIINLINVDNAVPSKNEVGDSGEPGYVVGTGDSTDHTLACVNLVGSVAGGGVETLKSASGGGKVDQVLCVELDQVGVTSAQQGINGGVAAHCQNWIAGFGGCVDGGNGSRSSRVRASGHGTGHLA